MKLFYYDDNFTKIEINDEHLQQAEWKVRTSGIENDDIRVVWIELYLPISKYPITQFVAHWYYGGNDDDYNQAILADYVKYNILPLQSSFMDNEDGKSIPLNIIKLLIDQLLLKNNYNNRK